MYSTYPEELFLGEGVRVVDLATSAIAATKEPLFMLVDRHALNLKQEQRSEVM